jgi:hypothetical protein
VSAVRYLGCSVNRLVFYLLLDSGKHVCLFSKLLRFPDKEMHYFVCV